MPPTLRRRKHIPLTPVICACCGSELGGSECQDGYRVRFHYDRLSGRRCPGAHRIDHQPVVVFRSDVLNDREVGR